MTIVHKTTTLYQDTYFHIKSADLVFDNGNTSTFEYADFTNDGDGAVMVVPVDSEGYFYFVKMFQIGVGSDVITFPKGGMSVDEDPCTRANLELQEEVGLKAEILKEVGILYSHPGRTTRKHHIILAQGLSNSSLVGDEIEAIEVLRLSTDQVRSLIMNGQIVDAKTVASFYIVMEYL